MQVFIIGSVYDTAKALDPKRLNKQIVECDQILDAIWEYSTAWANHPVTLMYKKHTQWLVCYKRALLSYKAGYTKDFEFYSRACKSLTPSFHIPEYFDQMKRRLYTKDNAYYKQWKPLGESEINWYFVNNNWRYYKNGKQLKK